MLAILVVIGTKYACNLDNVGNQICPQSQSRRGPFMPAILVTIGTKYACNFSFDRDHICLQSRIILNSFLTQDDHFQGVLKILEIAAIYGLQPIRLQAYIVPIKTEIAGIFCPQRNCYFRHIGSLP